MLETEIKDLETEVNFLEQFKGRCIALEQEIRTSKRESEKADLTQEQLRAQIAELEGTAE